MRKLLCCALVLAPLITGAVDLSPRYIDTFSEGRTFHRLYFADGPNKIGLSINAETEVTPESRGTLFRFPKFPAAAFLMIRSPQSPEDPFEGPSLERYRESARRLLPVQARSVKIHEETLNPLPINHWRSYKVLLSYEDGGQNSWQSVTFLNLNESDQIVLITSAPEGQFAEAAARSYQIIRSWQPLLPGDERPPQHN